MSKSLNKETLNQQVYRLLHPDFCQHKVDPDRIIKDNYSNHGKCLLCGMMVGWDNKFDEFQLTEAQLACYPQYTTDLNAAFKCIKFWETLQDKNYSNIHIDNGKFIVRIRNYKDSGTSGEEVDFKTNSDLALAVCREFIFAMGETPND